MRSCCYELTFSGLRHVTGSKYLLATRQQKILVTAAIPGYKHSGCVTDKLPIAARDIRSACSRTRTSITALLRFSSERLSGKVYCRNRRGIYVDFCTAATAGKEAAYANGTIPTHDPARRFTAVVQIARSNTSAVLSSATSRFAGRTCGYDLPGIYGRSL